MVRQINLAIPNLKTMAAEHAVDLAKLDWEPTERHFDAISLQLVLRTGVTCSLGIVVDGVDLVPQSHLETVSAIQPRDNTQLPGAALMEALNPGWEQRTRELDAGVDASVAQTIERAKKRLEKELATPMKAELVAHWESIGGHLPDSLPSPN